ncbi:hypothetical protein D3C80_20360 [compost metagenome]
MISPIIIKTEATMIKKDFLRYFDLSVLAEKDEIEYKSRNKLIVINGISCH